MLYSKRDINLLETVTLRQTTSWRFTETGLDCSAGYSIIQHWNIDSCMSVAWTKSLKPTSLCENQSADSLEPVPLSPLSLSLALFPSLLIDFPV